MGARRAQRQASARTGHGRRHLRRLLRPSCGGACRSRLGARQLRRHASRRLRRGRDHAPHVPLGRKRVPHQRHGCAPYGRARHPSRLGAWDGHALDHLAGQPRLHPAIEARRPPRAHRRGRGNAQAQAAQGEKRAQAGPDGSASRACARRDRRGRTSAETARAQGEARPHLHRAFRRALRSEAQACRRRLAPASGKACRRHGARGSRCCRARGEARGDFERGSCCRGAAGKDPPRGSERRRAYAPASPSFGRR